MNLIRAANVKRTVASSDVRKPDFFLIGAPKAGTTSLCRYLAEHPHIYMPPQRELLFWFRDLTGDEAAETIAGYWEHFSGAGEHHQAIGEWTVTYLASVRAVPQILQHVPDPRFIVMLRHPVDLAYAWHTEMLRGGHETVEDFEVAWSLDGDRSEGRNLSRPDVVHWWLRYRRIASLGTQLERLYSLVPREQVFVRLLSDLGENPRRLYVELLNFLGVDDDHRADFPRMNQNYTLRSSGLAKLTDNRSKLRQTVSTRLKQIIGVPNAELLGAFRRFNQKPVKRPALCPAFRAQLCEELRPEVEILQHLLDRDISDWFV